MKMNARIAALATIFVFSAPVAASAQVVTDAVQVQSGHYVIEPMHTQVSFSVLHFGFSVYEGLLSGASGFLDLDAAKPKASSLSVSIPLDSVQTTSAKLTEELKGSEWFATAQYPAATFMATDIKQTGRDSALVTGDLTLHGVTKPETLRVHFIGAGVNMLDKKYTVGFDASATIKRSDFGVKMFVPYVSDEVELRIAGVFEKQDVAPQVPAATSTPDAQKTATPAVAPAPTQTNELPKDAKASVEGEAKPEPSVPAKVETPKVTDEKAAQSAPEHDKAASMQGPATTTEPSIKK